MRAVVCDDDELVRELLASALTRAGVEVVGKAGSAPDAIHLVEILKPDLLLLDEVMPGMGGIEAPDGAEGLEAVRAHHPDAVVLDILLPDIDGLQVLTLLKEDARTSTVPVIVLSAKSDSVAIDFAMRTGAVDWLVKPCDPLE